MAPDGAFAVDSLRLNETLRFSALGHRDLYRTAGPLYEWPGGDTAFDQSNP